VPAPLLKICGLRRADQAAAVAALGVDALGVIAVPGTPRWLNPAERPALFGAMGRANPHCRGVLVVADPEDGDLDPLRPEQGGHALLQLHGQETPERCVQLSTLLGCPLWKALRIAKPSDLNQVHAYSGVSKRCCSMPGCRASSAAVAGGSRSNGWQASALGCLGGWRAVFRRKRWVRF